MNWHAFWSTVSPFVGIYLLGCLLMFLGQLDDVHKGLRYNLYRILYWPKILIKRIKDDEKSAYD